jgi:hypothetical protein
MPSKPPAFPNFKDCISFKTSQGRKLTGMSSSTVARRASIPWNYERPTISAPYVSSARTA